MQAWAECLTGGLAACCACVFSNPLEVVKTRMQLQGELQASGTYKVHYRNVFHAFYTIGKNDGILALQKGLGLGMTYQFIMNGIRLGTFQQITNAGLTKDDEGNLSLPKCLIGGAVSGCLGAFVASPSYMLKTQLQAKANTAIAVGTQHDIQSVSSTLKTIFQNHGITGLWRGASGAMLRVTFGSASQLTAFSKCKEKIIKSKIFEEGSLMIPVTSSMSASVVVVMVMTPFDVVSTRLYNQPVCKETGKGLMYNNVFDVFRKIFKTEGFVGFYKGLGPHYFRVGPHTILSLVIWDKFRQMLMKEP